MDFRARKLVAVTAGLAVVTRLRVDGEVMAIRAASVVVTTAVVLSGSV